MNPLNLYRFSEDLGTEALGPKSLSAHDFFEKLYQPGEPSFIFESYETDGRTPSRFSVIGTKPLLSLKIQNDKLTLEGSGLEKKIFLGNPMTHLKEWVENLKVHRDTGVDHPALGLFGYFGYDCIRYLETLTLPARPSYVDQESVFYIFQNYFVFDRVKSRLMAVSYSFQDKKQAVDLSFLKKRGVQKIQKTLRNKKPNPEKYIKISSKEKEGFKAQVSEIKNHIRQGDIFQCVISKSFSFKVEASPFEIYRSLWKLNPGPYHFFLDCENSVVLGASPEMLVKIGDGRRVQTCPIAGTRKRTGDPAQDKKLSKNLTESVKERAEHMMLVDLGRNDLGRISQAGTVKVVEFMKVKMLSHVMHLVSLVEGTLKNNLSPLEAFYSCFPAGTLSGAPKIRAMEIISELEPHRRGFYGGALLMTDFQGHLDSCITIRSLVYENGQITIQAGAGIVADSTAEREFQEIFDKTRALRTAIAEVDRL